MHKVVVGAGPAGLACATLQGLDIRLQFEAFHIAGGVLMYGIPEFRLPRNCSKIQPLKDLGVEIKTNMVIGKILPL